jgi:hypothetical protein
MESDKKEMYLIADRVYHIFNCSNIYNFSNQVGRYGGLWEPYFMMDNALRRTAYISEQATRASIAAVRSTGRKSVIRAADAIKDKQESKKK